MNKKNTIIAVAGKGGVGKTTIASLLIRYLVKQADGSVLAVDADPNSNLGEVLGFDSGQDIGRIIDDVAKNFDKIPASMSKDEFISYQIETTLGEAKGFDLLTMGRPEGPGCYCYVNNVLRNTISKLISNYNFVVIDNEAGFEHLSRKILRKIDILLIVSDETPIGLKAAKRIFNLVKELKIEYKKIYLIVNRAKRHNITTDIAVELIGTILENENVPSYIQGKIMDLGEDIDIIKETNNILMRIKLTERR